MSPSVLLLAMAARARRLARRSAAPVRAAIAGRRKPEVCWVGYTEMLDEGCVHGSLYAVLVGYHIREWSSGLLWRSFELSPLLTFIFCYCGEQCASNWRIIFAFLTNESSACEETGWICGRIVDRPAEHVHHGPWEPPLEIIYSTIDLRRTNSNLQLKCMLQWPKFGV